MHFGHTFCHTLKPHTLPCICIIIRLMHFSIINGFATRVYMQICFLAAARWGAISSVKRTDTHTHVHTYKKTRFLPLSAIKWERSRGLCADAKSQRVPSAVFKSAQVRVSDALQLSHTHSHIREHTRTPIHIAVAIRRAHPNECNYLSRNFRNGSPRK